MAAEHPSSRDTAAALCASYDTPEEFKGLAASGAASERSVISPVTTSELYAPERPASPDTVELPADCPEFLDIVVASDREVSLEWLQRTLYRPVQLRGTLDRLSGHPMLHVYAHRQVDAFPHPDRATRAAPHLPRSLAPTVSDIRELLAAHRQCYELEWCHLARRLAAPTAKKDVAKPRPSVPRPLGPGPKPAFSVSPTLY